MHIIASNNQRNGCLNKFYNNTKNPFQVQKSKLISQLNESKFFRDYFALDDESKIEESTDLPLSDTKFDWKISKLQSKKGVDSNDILSLSISMSKLKLEKIDSTQK